VEALNHKPAGHASAATAVPEAGWQSPSSSLSGLGPLIEAAGVLQERMVVNLWAIQHAPAKPTEKDAMRALLLLTRARGRNPVPFEGDQEFARAVGVRWSNLQPAIVSCQAKQMMRRTVHPNRAVEYYFIEPDAWQFGDRTDEWLRQWAKAKSHLEEICRRGPVEIEQVLKLCALEDFSEREARRRKRSEARNKSGQGRPCITRSEIQKTTELPGFLALAASSDFQKMTVGPTPDPSVNGPCGPPAFSESQNVDPFFRKVEDSKLQALRRGESERDFMKRCRIVLSDDVMENDGGKWRMRFRKWPSKSLRVLAAIESDTKEGKMITSPGGYMEDLWKRFADF